MRMPKDVEDSVRRNGYHPEGIDDVVASGVTIRPVEWLWHGRIPKGKLTMFDGDPDLGKSVVTMDLAARVSTGRAFPDGAKCQAGNVLVCNVEDGKDDTIVPRLMSHGADLDRVFVFSGVPDGRGGTRLLDLPDDIVLLEKKVNQREAALLVLDPALTMLSGDVYKDQEARKALAPVRDMAERTGAAVIAVRHLNKNVSLKAIQRGGGNMGLIGVARAGAFFAEHPDDERLRVMAQHKSNLAEKPASLSYRVVSSTVHDTARIEWAGTTDHDANSLAAAGFSPHEKSVLDEAVEWLRGELEGGPVMARQIFKDARDSGISETTLRRAKTTLHVKSERQGTEGWAWRLPEGDYPPREDGDEGRAENDSESQSEASEGDQRRATDGDDHVGHVDHLRNFEGGDPLDTPHKVEDDQDDQGDHRDHDQGDHGHLPPPLSVADVREEIRRSGSGPARALAHHLQDPTNETKLRYLAIAVLVARRMDTALAERCVGVVREAAADARNHPLGCGCDECA
jgi:hypothetical protein